jgi:molybdopterin converting factor small subunit
VPEVRILGPLREALGASSLRLAPGSAGEILRALAARGSPEVAGRLFADPAVPGPEVERDLHVLVNGRSIEHLDGLATRVRESDVVTVYRMGARGWPGG